MRLLRRHFVLALLLASPSASTLAAQQGRIAADVDASSSPGGGVVASLRGGTTWPTGATRNGFTSVTIEAWIDASRFAGPRDSFPVTIGGTANLRIRQQPSLQGAILGSFRAGAGIRILERRDTWARIRREVWVPSGSIAVQAAAAPSGATTTPNRPPATPPITGAPAPTTRPNTPASGTPAAPTPSPSQPTTAPAAQPNRTAPATTPAGAGASSPAPGTAPRPVGPAGTLRSERSVPLRQGPNGPALGQLEPGVVVTPQARDRGWVKVQVEAWVPESLFVPADTAFGSTLTAADLRANPDGHRGKIVRWEVQVVGMQTADPLRRDMERDEAFLLAMGPVGEDAILYITVPPRMLEEARALQPLANVLLTARVRTGRSNPTGAPVLELISILRK
jgi:hypothetical protein